MLSYNLISSMATQRYLKVFQIKKFISTSVFSTAKSQNRNDNELTKILLDPKTNIATLFLNRLPANALSAELMKQIKNSVNELERQNVAGIIITSTSERIFSAGLDLYETYQRSPEHLTELWNSLQNMWKALFSTKLPTAALINGHALAGGFVIALSCDYRVVLPNLTIGLNETQVGIAVPCWVVDTYLNVIKNRRIAESDLIASKCYKSVDALDVGLVDDVVGSREEGLQKCIEFLKSYEGPTRMAMVQTKLNFRSHIIEEFERNRKKDLDTFLSSIQRSDVQKFLDNYMRSLKEKRAKK